ncbi:unnamed protein product [Medioppia subpectinata]|uniref:BPTI/Kunitz inhibitor domain-containing protein n=1 Tax=Medioppia subpectinata TaxID=1979941 RepID=A0A7R9PZI1_9ACAR|nr:unnamed protein product [Medioppia subpectinata]CAG2106500.1 unnamed protein product [Medioppia subpectinata]
MATILTLILIILPLFGYSHQNPGMTVPAPGESIDTPSREVVVQHPVTVQIADPSPMTTPPSMSALKTRVVVVHNNMVPVPIECFQPPDSGTCSKDLARIYYDHETRTCKPFSYTGCGGNANRFQSIKNCYRICHPYR